MHESADRQFVWIIVFIKYLAGDMTEVPSIKMSGGSGESGQKRVRQAKPVLRLCKDDGAGYRLARVPLCFY